MRFYVVSDNMDTLTGMRLAGMEGGLAHTKQQAQELINHAMEDEEIGIILVTSLLASQCDELLTSLRKIQSKTLILEIPTRHSEQSTGDAVSRYIREAVGIQI